MAPPWGTYYDGLPVAVAVIADTGQITYANERAARILADAPIPADGAIIAHGARWYAVSARSAGGGEVVALVDVTDSVHLWHVEQALARRCAGKID
jgi:membrane-bound ClpP family serine protease